MNAHNQVLTPVFVKRPLEPCAPKSFNPPQNIPVAPAFCSKLQLQLQQSQTISSHNQQQVSSTVAANPAIGHHLCSVDDPTNNGNSKLTFVSCPKPSRKALFNKVAAYNHTPPPSRFMPKVEDEDDEDDDLYDDDYSDDDDEDEDDNDFKSRDDDGVFFSD